MDIKSGTIVVGVDASDSSLRALAWAVEQAQIEHRAITLVYAVNTIAPVYKEATTVHPEEVQAALRDDGRHILAAARSAVERAAPELEVYEVFRTDDPRYVLLEMSRDAAMVVLGSRGRGKLRSLLLGSVGVALVRHAHCPVVIHRPAHPGLVRNGVVVGADGSADSLPVLEFAYREASVRGLPLTVVHCYWDVNTGSSEPYFASSAPIDLESERLLLAESLAGMAEKFPDVKVKAAVARGLPQEVLVSLGQQMNLLVVGAHQAGRVSRMLFGSVSVAVVEHAACPVAVIPTATAD
jgi:nucleotide-binding universal stress UspA family protein